MADQDDLDKYTLPTQPAAPAASGDDLDKYVLMSPPATAPGGMRVGPQFPQGAARPSQQQMDEAFQKSASQTGTTLLDWAPAIVGGAAAATQPEFWPAVGYAVLGGGAGSLIKQGGQTLQGAPPEDIPTAAYTTGMDMLTAGASEAGGRLLFAPVEMVGGWIKNKLIRPQRLYQSALRPSITLGEPGIKKVVETGLREGIPVGEGGLKQARGLIEDVSQQVDNIIQQGNKLGKVIDPNKVAGVSQEIQPLFQKQVNPNADVNALNSSVQEFLKKHSYQAPYTEIAPHPWTRAGVNPDLPQFYKTGEGATTLPDFLTPVEAQEEKQGTYIQLRKKYGQLGSADIEAQKGLARGLKEQLELLFPDLKALNARDSSLIALEKQLARQVARAGNLNIVPLGSMVSTGMGAASGHLEAGLATGFLKKMLDSPELKSRLAIAIYHGAQAGSRAGRILAPAAVRAATVTHDLRAGKPVTLDQSQYQRSPLWDQPQYARGGKVRYDDGGGVDSDTPTYDPNLFRGTPRVVDPTSLWPSRIQLDPERSRQNLFHSFGQAKPFAEQPPPAAKPPALPLPWEQQVQQAQQQPTDKWDQAYERYINRPLLGIPNFIGSSIARGAGELGRGVERYADVFGNPYAGEASTRELAGATHDVAGGVMGMSAPLMLAGGITAPIRTGAALAFGSLGQGGVEAGLQRLGLPVEYAQVAGDLGGLIAGGMGEHLTGEALGALRARVEPLLQQRWQAFQEQGGVGGLRQRMTTAADVAHENLRQRGAFQGATTSMTGGIEGQDIRDLATEAGGRFGSGVLASGQAAVKGAQLIRQGITDFGSWAQGMKQTLGDWVPDSILQKLFPEAQGLAVTAEQDVKRRSMQDLDIRIPDNVRAASPDVTRTLSGQPFHALDLEQPSEGFLPLRQMGPERANALVQEIWQRAIQESEAGGGSTALDAVKKTGARPPDANFFDQAFSLPQRARYWYELSGESFTGKHMNIPRELQPAFIDAVAGTSGGVEPGPNLQRAIGIFSEKLQNLPVMTDLRDPASARRALNPSGQDLQSLKYGSFSGTMQHTAGLSPKAPLTTNDVQVASMFGIKGNDIGSNPVMYEVMSRFFLGLRDAQNGMLPEGAQPWETWQMQAPAWVHERITKNPAKASEYDDYSQVFPAIIAKLRKAGIPTPDGKITMETLMDPRTPNVMSGTREQFLKTPYATVETATSRSAPGAAAAVLKSQLGQLDPSIPWVRDAHDDYQQVQRNSMRALAMRKTRTVEPTFQYSTSQTPMGTPQHSITMHAGDQPVGHITLLEKPDHFQVDDVEVNKDLRGKGYGNALYRQALDYAGQAGKPELRSGQTPSEDAQKVWQSLGAQPFTENYASPESGDYSLQRYRLAGAEGLPPARPVKPFKIQDPSLISQLMSHIVGKPVDVSRLDWNGYGTFENQLSPNLRIPLTGRTSQGKWANLSTKQRQTFLSILGQDLNQDAMAASHFATVPHGEGDTHSVFVNRYDGEVNQPAIARFSQAVGLPLNVTQHPNGTVIDLNTPPGFAKPDVERVRSLAEETFGDDPNVHDIGIISRKYKSDYIKRNQYERIIGKQTPAPSQGAPDIAPGVGGVRPADGDPGGLAGIRASLQRIAAQQDLEMGKWHQTYSTRLENHLSQEAARLAKQQALQAKQAARQQKRGLFSPPPPESPPVP